MTIRFSGILGLGFPRDNPVTPISFLERLDEEIGMFTIFLKGHEGEYSHDGGAITWGSLDDDHCERDVHFINLTLGDENPENHWQFLLDGFDYPGKVKRNTPEVQPKAMVDSGSEYITLPFFEMYAFTDACGAEYVDKIGYAAPCSTNFPTMRFKINDRVFDVPPSQYVKKDTTLEGRCILRVDGTPVEEGIPDFILGTPFMQTKCVIHDIGNKRVGFSKTKM